jgi:hypothetical protein
MSYAGPPSICIAPDDLRVVAEALKLRLPLRGAETRRVARMHELLERSSELGRAMTQQTHCGRVHCQGSHGAGDLMADTATLQHAFAAYASLVRAVADEYRGVVDGVPSRFDRTIDAESAPLSVAS